MMARFKCILVLAVTLIHIEFISANPPCEDGQFVRSDDCKSFWHCSPTTENYISCNDGMVFSSAASTCVPIGSHWDDCDSNTDPRTTREPMSIEQQCASGADILPHPGECQVFYNCSQKISRISYNYENYVDECPYPKLFSLVSYKCEDFEMVDCGSRREAKAGCDYRRFRCPRSHCTPCWVNSPSCKNQTDGIRVYENRPWSPYYVRCYKERTIKTGYCNKDRNNMQMLFSPVKEKCVTLFEVPKEHGGLMPECGDKPDGLYPDEHGICPVYFKCENYEVVDVVWCDKGTLFDTLTKTCQEGSNSCAPCGGKTMGCS